MKLIAAMLVALAVGAIGLAQTATKPAASAPTRPATTSSAPAGPVSATAPAPPTTAPAPATGQLTVPPNPPGTTARAIIIAGTGGVESYSRNVQDWASRFQAVLTKQCGLKSQDIIFLSEKPDAQANPPRRPASVEDVRAALDEMNKALSPDDQLIIFLAGLGQINEPIGKLCLPGPDLKADELADRLARMPTSKIVVINTVCGGADFLKNYMADGRVILTAAGAESDGTQTYFAEFVIRAYETGRADTNKDGLIDMLEAYVYAAKETCNFYHRQYMLLKKDQKLKENEPIPWLVRGKETRQIWKRLYAGTSNELTVPKDMEKGQAPLPADLDNEPDPECVFGRFGPEWYNRRVLAERSRLDDTAKSEKALFMWKPYEFEEVPASASPGETTYMARRTVLGFTGMLKLAAPATASAPATSTSRPASMPK